MPVEVVGRATRQVLDASCVDHASLRVVGRLSSFGFSGTIAHGLFASALLFDISHDDGRSLTSTSLFRAQ